jgi:AraC family transcriptional regulator of adaptative response/methylated-DNA-[protein]-cysteine methyltransferase
MINEAIRRVDEHECWEAVQNKDKRFDGRFVVAVRSTGVYCRPSCPSRIPLRKNVTFFMLPEAAENAGFRACKRCQPREVSPSDPQAEVVQRACRYIDAHLDETPSLEDLGTQVSLSPFHLQRTFKQVMGVTPRQYADGLRVSRFKAQLREGDSVTDALYEVGYGSSSRLYERTDSHLGMTPSTYRKGGVGMDIRYTVVDCPLGRLLVAATERGVCAVSLSGEDDVLVKALHEEYPAADISRDEGGISAWVQVIVDYLNGWQPHLDLPLDLQATAFQLRVWQELRAIPYGETRSYSQIAKSMGNPKATRAVARACATNPAALVIPCHRVVREDGDLGGYRWGIARKAALLETEKKAVSG